MYGRYWWRKGVFFLSKISLINWVFHSFPSQAVNALYWFAITNGTQSVSDNPIARFEVRTAVFLKIQDDWSVSAVPWSAFLSSWRNLDPSECQELFNQLYRIISQKNWCISNPFIDKIFLGEQLCQLITEFQLTRDLLVTDVAGCLRLFYCCRWPHNLQVLSLHCTADVQHVCCLFFILECDWWKLVHWHRRPHNKT